MIHVIEYVDAQCVTEEVDRWAVVTECRQGPPGFGSAPVRSVVAAGAAADIIALDASLTRAYKCILALTDLAADRTCTSEVLISRVATEARHVQYGLIGSKFDVEITSDVVAGQLVLGVINNELVSVQIDAVQVGSISV